MKELAQQLIQAVRDEAQTRAAVNDKKAPFLERIQEIETEMLAEILAENKTLSEKEQDVNDLKNKIITEWNIEDKQIVLDDGNTVTKRCNKSLTILDEYSLKEQTENLPLPPFDMVLKWDKKKVRGLVENGLVLKDAARLEEKVTVAIKLTKEVIE